jgi:hypothetical protein
LTPYRSRNPAAVIASFRGRIINHFTDESGITGIIGDAVRTLEAGRAITVMEARFATGSADFLANAPGDIFVTDLPNNASSLQLALIGVFGAKQEYAISMGEGQLVAQGIAITWTAPARGIGVIPGGMTVAGPLVVTRRPIP